MEIDAWEKADAIGEEVMKLSMPYETIDSQYHWPQLINLGNLTNYAMPSRSK